MLIDPVIISIGPLEIRWYGVVYVIGMLLAFYMVKKKRKLLKIDKKGVDDFLMYLMIGMLIGARVFHFLVADPKVFFTRPWELLMVWHGGMSFFGGLIGAVAGTYLFCRKTGARFWRIADVVVVPTTFALGLGRIANFINNELVGRVTNVAWCIDFPGYIGCRHPYQLYASATHFVMFGVLLYFSTKKTKSGYVFSWFLLLYGLFRFLTDFVRDDPTWMGLTVWQYLSVGLFGAGLYLVWKRS